MQRLHFLPLRHRAASSAEGQPALQLLQQHQQSLPPKPRPRPPKPVGSAPKPLASIATAGAAASSSVQAPGADDADAAADAFDADEQAGVHVRSSSPLPAEADEQQQPQQLHHPDSPSASSSSRRGGRQQQNQPFSDVHGSNGAPSGAASDDVHIELGDSTADQPDF